MLSSRRKVKLLGCAQEGGCDDIDENGVRSTEYLKTTHKAAAIASGNPECVEWEEEVSVRVGGVE
jgi:hypothetical protein